MTIKVQITGGLGNQLFQYFFARSLNVKFKCKVLLDISNFTLNNKSRSLNINNLDLRLPFFKRKNYFKDFFLTKNKDENLFKFNQKIFNKRYDNYIGYWQSYKYFTDNWEFFKDEINLEKFNTDFQTLNQIKSSNSISVHIRRGDYITNLKTSAVHGNLKLDYYKKAIHLIQKQFKNSIFFFFSDDIEWVKNNFNDKNFHFVENNYNDLNLPFKDLLLMKNCKHNIIANSTFSWWGAWLNEYPNKIVYAPEYWTTKIKSSDTDLIPKDWIIL
tara:strand:+ start:1843 stop:2658 length:816 start_codon:yes stop_codon:yes gene_type:complete